MPYLHLVFSLPFTYFFPLSFSKPPRYHSDTTLLPLYYHPVLSPYLATCPLLDGFPSRDSRLSNILHLQRSNLPTTGAQRRSTAKRTTTCHPPPVKCSALIRRVSPPLYPTLFTFLLRNLHTCKFCCTFVPDSVKCYPSLHILYSVISPDLII